MSTEKEYICGLKREDFQTTVNGKKTDLFVLTNKKGHEVAFTNYGGAIVAIMMPDREGKMANVIQGQNDGQNSLHGGPKGFHAKVWKARQMSDNSVALLYTSSYGEESFTGEVKICVEYTFTDNDELIIEYLATTNKKTIINLTHHAYFSLAGIANPTPAIDDLRCEINADFYLPVDNECIPTGEILKVADTPFDFRTPKAIGRDINADNEQLKNGNGYDHCYVLNKKEEGELSFAAKITEPASGRTMAVYTTEPGMQMYSDNWGNGCPGQHGATFPKRSAVCFECQHFPDSPNRPYFPSVILEPGCEYKQKTIYAFSVEN
ncbi:MAG: aldose epimerase family protein [Prevotella sp.]|nr:aldose epimerase family protein [Prevotella sp.]